MTSRSPVSTLSATHSSAARTSTSSETSQTSLVTSSHASSVGSLSSHKISTPFSTPPVAPLSDTTWETYSLSSASAIRGTTTVPSETSPAVYSSQTTSLPYSISTTATISISVIIFSPLSTAPSGGQTHSSKTVLTTVIVTVVVLLALGALATCLVYRRRKKKIADTAEGVLYAHHRKEGGISENDYSVELASGHITVAHLAAGFHDTIEGQDDHTSAWSHTYPLSAPYSTLSSSVDLPLGDNYDPRLSEYGSGHGLGDVKVVPATPTAYERDFPSPLEQSSLNATLADIPSNWSHTALEIRPNVSLFSIPAFPSAERPPSHFPGGPLVRAVPRPDMPSLYSTSIYGHAAPRHLSIPSHISSPPSTPQASVPVSLPTVGHPLQIAERTESPVAAVPPCVWLISERGAVRYTPHLLSYQVGSHGTSGDLEVSPWRTMEPVPDATRQYVTEGRTLPSPPPPPPYSSDKE
ncbi:hypothetical protein C8Q72DRAFT_900626 [Fomitopsis betulina]|nr:hypothetical protein C8Q72DRAFT_900626 [Fomitopsis betulina]